MKLSPRTMPFEGTAPAAEASWSVAEEPPRRSPTRRLRHPFVWLVILPTLISAIYFFAFASPQYVSEARFVVRGRSEPPANSMLGSMIGRSSGLGAAMEAASVRDYLTSHDAVTQADERLNLVEIYTRPEADFWARLWWTEPERLTRYFSGMVTTTLDSTTGVTTLRVRSFRPEDSKAVAETLLELSEQVVNSMSERAREDALALARREVEVAEARVVAAREALTAFREREQNLDAMRAAAIAMEGIGGLEAALTAARAELQEKSAFMRQDNPQLQTLRNRIAALETQIARERSRHTRGDDNITQQLAAYERLMLEREFADKQLASATASLELARIEAQRQQLYLARIVQPNLAVYPLYPRKVFSVASIFFGLTVAYGIGWLLVAGMREHAV